MARCPLRRVLLSRGYHSLRAGPAPPAPRPRTLRVLFHDLLDGRGGCQELDDWGHRRRAHRDRRRDSRGRLRPKLDRDIERAAARAPTATSPAFRRVRPFRAEDRRYSSQATSTGSATTPGPPSRPRHGTSHSRRRNSSSATLGRTSGPRRTSSAIRASSTTRGRTSKWSLRRRSPLLRVSRPSPPLRPRAASFLSVTVRRANNINQAASTSKPTHRAHTKAARPAALRDARALDTVTPPRSSTAASARSALQPVADRGLGR